MLTRFQLQPGAAGPPGSAGRAAQGFPSAAKESRLHGLVATTFEMSSPNGKSASDTHEHLSSCHSDAFRARVRSEHMAAELASGPVWLASGPLRLASGRVWLASRRVWVASERGLVSIKTSLVSNGTSLVNIRTSLVSIRMSLVSIGTLKLWDALPVNDNRSHTAISSLMGASWLKATHKESAVRSNNE